MTGMSNKRKHEVVYAIMIIGVVLVGGLIQLGYYSSGDKNVGGQATAIDYLDQQTVDLNGYYKTSTFGCSDGYSEDRTVDTCLTYGQWQALATSICKRQCSASLQANCGLTELKVALICRQ